MVSPEKRPLYVISSTLYIDLERPSTEPMNKPRDPFDDISNPLAHARHPPTRALYIDNFRRPLDLAALRELLEEQGELDDAEVKTGLWVSGVKSHIYVVVSPPSVWLRNSDLGSLELMGSTGNTVQIARLCDKSGSRLARPRIPAHLPDETPRRIRPFQPRSEPRRKGRGRLEGREETDEPRHPDRPPWRGIRGDEQKGRGRPRQGGWRGCSRETGTGSGKRPTAAHALQG